MLVLLTTKKLKEALADEKNKEFKKTVEDLFIRGLKEVLDEDSKKSKSEQQYKTHNPKEFLQSILEDPKLYGADWIFVAEYGKCIALLCMQKNYNEKLKEKIDEHVQIGNVIINNDECDDSDMFKKIIKVAIRHIINKKMAGKVVFELRKGDNKFNISAKKLEELRFTIRRIVYDVEVPFYRQIWPISYYWGSYKVDKTYAILDNLKRYYLY